MQCVENVAVVQLATILSVRSANNSSEIQVFDTSDFYSEESSEPTDCIWRRSELTALEFVIYAFVVPSLAFFGLCANFINAIVFMRPKMTPSAFSYLAALSWLDCISCILITLTALSRSFLHLSTRWMAYDFQWQTPLFSMTTGAANLILACVSLDRFIYLRWGIPNGTPKFCRRIVARRMILIVILLAIFVNIPYFFVFVVNDDGTFEATKFYFSKYYMIHNWFTFILLTLLPAIFLMLGNAAILIAFWKWTQQSKKCQNNSNANIKNGQNRYRHQMKLTVTIIIVISLYLIGELPAHLTSRKSIVNLLYGGDVSKVNLKNMQRLEVICITLNAIQLSMNIIVYAVINPSFLPEFFSCLKGASDKCCHLMGFIALAKCWSKCFTSEKLDRNHHSQNGIHHKGSECTTDSKRHCKHCQDTGAEHATNNVKDQKQEFNVSVIFVANLKKTFDNASFYFEI